MKKSLLLLLIAFAFVLFPRCNGEGTEPHTSLGVVVFEDNPRSLLSGAAVTVQGRSGTTNNDGIVQFIGIRPGPSTVTVTKAGYADASAMVTIEDGQGVIVPIPMVRR